MVVIASAKAGSKTSPSQFNTVSPDDERLVALIPRVASKLESEVSNVREEAVTDLCKLSHLAQASAIHDAVDPRLAHASSQVRCSALEALKSLVEVGDPAAVDSVIEKSVDTSVDVRKVAAGLLSAVPSDDGELAASVVSHLKSRKWEERAVTLYLLGRLADKENTIVITAMAECLGDANQEVRKAALREIRHLVQKGAPAALSAVIIAAAHTRLDIRKAATELLREFGKPGDKMLISAAVKSMENEDWQVRFAACFALQKVAVKGNEAAISASSRLLSDQHWQIRSAAIDILLRTVSKSKCSAAIIAKLAECIADSEVKVRIKAAKALEQLAEKDDKALLVALTSHLNSDRWEVRSSALRTIGRVTSRGKSDVVRAACECLRDKKWSVRWDAARTLNILGDPTLYPVVERYLDDVSWGVRLFAVLVLWNFAKHGYGSSTGSFLAVFCAIVFGFVVASGFWTTQIQVPYKPQEPSIICWLPCLIVRVAATFGLWRLIVKGFKTPAGTSVVVITSLFAASIFWQRKQEI